MTTSMSLPPGRFTIRITSVSAARLQRLLKGTP